MYYNIIAELEIMACNQCISVALSPGSPESPLTYTLRKFNQNEQGVGIVATLSDIAFLLRIRWLSLLNFVG